jgi:ThiF family
MMAKEPQLLDNFFRGEEGVQLIKGFRSNRGGGEFQYEGKITITREAEVFAFKVGVPGNFPLRGLGFFYEGDRVARHLLRAGYVCVASPFTASFADKLAADLDALVEWIDRYVQHPEDGQYEYLLTPASAFVMLFDEEPKERVEAKRYGQFGLKPLPGHLGLAGLMHNTFLAYGLGGAPPRWSHFYNTLPSEQIGTGFYFLLDKEPLDAQGKFPESDAELMRLLDEEMIGYIHSLPNMTVIHSPILDYIPIALGYPILSAGGLKEVHWEWVLVNGKWTNMIAKAGNLPSLTWGKSINIAPSRFYGRGAFSDQLCAMKVLLLGAGAIGSSLAESLVRGGIRNLELIDGDHVEPGNVCRSTYAIAEIHGNKADALFAQLILLTPYANIRKGGFAFQPCFPDEGNFQASKTSLQSFDLIFDCTADDAVAYTLDQMQLQADIVNLTITDEARQLLAVTNRGGEAILPQKNRILHSLQGDAPASPGPTFYEGMGCWHPTFRASFADINLLLQHFLVGANRRIALGHGWATTILERRDGEYGIRVVQREDV